MPTRKKAAKTAAKPRPAPLPKSGTIAFNDKRIRDYKYNTYVNEMIVKSGRGPTKVEQKRFEESIVHEGVQESIVLWKQPNGTLLVVAGRRRRAAVKKARKEIGKAYPFTEIPYILREFKSDFKARAFVVKDNVRSRAQSWNLTNEELVGLVYPPQEYAAIYKDLKNNIPYDEMNIDRAKATAEQVEKARQARLKERAQQQAARMEAADALGIPYQSFLKTVQQIQRRIGARPRKAPPKLILEGEKALEANIIARQKREAVKRRKARVRKIEKLREEDKKEDSLIAAMDRRLKKIGSGNDPERVEALALRKKVGKIPKAKQEKYSIKQPVVNRRGATKEDQGEKPKLTELLFEG